MAFKCGNCNVEFPNRKKWLEHMIDVHNSPIVEGDEKDIQYCEKYANEKNQEQAKKVINDHKM